MVFIGVSKAFSLKNEEQYDTIGAFWDEMAAVYGLENLQGLGYGWKDGIILYAIGLKQGEIPHANATITLPDDGWECVRGRTDDLQQIYREIYQDGPLEWEIETFDENGDCEIRYYRKNSKGGGQVCV